MSSSVFNNYQDLRIAYRNPVIIDKKVKSTVNAQVQQSVFWPCWRYYISAKIIRKNLNPFEAVVLGLSKITTSPQLIASACGLNSELVRTVQTVLRTKNLLDNHFAITQEGQQQLLNYQLNKAEEISQNFYYVYQDAISGNLIEAVEIANKNTTFPPDNFWRKKVSVTSDNEGQKTVQITFENGKEKLKGIDFEGERSELHKFSDLNLNAVLNLFQLLKRQKNIEDFDGKNISIADEKPEACYLKCNAYLVSGDVKDWHITTGFNSNVSSVLSNAIYRLKESELDYFINAAQMASGEGEVSVPASEIAAEELSAEEKAAFPDYKEIEVLKNSDYKLIYESLRRLQKIYVKYSKLHISTVDENREARSICEEIYDCAYDCVQNCFYFGAVNSVKVQEVLKNIEHKGKYAIQNQVLKYLKSSQFDFSGKGYELESIKPLFEKSSNQISYSYDSIEHCELWALVDLCILEQAINPEIQREENFISVLEKENPQCFKQILKITQVRNPLSHSVEKIEAVSLEEVMELYKNVEKIALQLLKIQNSYAFEQKNSEMTNNPGFKDLDEINFKATAELQKVFKTAWNNIPDKFYEQLLQLEASFIKGGDNKSESINRIYKILQSAFYKLFLDAPGKIRTLNESSNLEKVDELCCLENPELKKYQDYHRQSEVQENYKELINTNFSKVEKELRNRRSNSLGTDFLSFAYSTQDEELREIIRNNKGIVYCVNQVIKERGHKNNLQTMDVSASDLEKLKTITYRFIKYLADKSRLI